MKKRVDVFSDGSISISELAEGYDVQIFSSDLGLPVDSFEPTDEQVEYIKTEGLEKLKFDTEKNKITKKPIKKIII